MSTEDNLNRLIADIDKHIKRIESDINRSNVTKETIDLFNKVNDERKKLFALDVNKDILKEIKKKYGGRILTLKKSLIFYYNSNVVLMIYMLKDMISKVELIDDKKEKELLLGELNNLEIPKIYDKNISNFQDNLNIDFDKFIYTSEVFNKFREKILIDDKNYGDVEIGYVLRYVIPKISDLIQRYNDGERVTTKQSINTDIMLCRVKIRDIERKYKDDEGVSRQCLKARNRLDELNTIVTKPKEKQNNNEYYSFKDEIMVFIQEINNYYTNVDKINYGRDLPEFKRRYKNYLLKIQTTYKGTNTQLYNNLIKYLNEVDIIIKKMEEDINLSNPKPNDVHSEQARDEEQGYYRVETIESANDFYRRYSKPIMLASAVGSMALINTSVGPVLIPTIIFANVVAANKYPIIDKINEILEKAVGAKRDSNKEVIKRNGIKLDIEDALNGLLKGISLLDKKRKDVINNLILRVRDSATVAKIRDRTDKKDEEHAILKDSLLDIKFMKLYYEFILSGLSLEEFCKVRGLSNDEYDVFADYIQYRDDNDRGSRQR